MRRRDFLGIASGGLVAALASARQPLLAQAVKAAGDGLAWKRNGQTGLFEQVSANGQPLVRGEQGGLLAGFCRQANSDGNGREIVVSAVQRTGQGGAIRLCLAHRLLALGDASNEDVLEASLSVSNTSAEKQTIEIGFQSAASPCERFIDQQVYLPISASGIFSGRGLGELGNGRGLQNCHRNVKPEGFSCHYLEPRASNPDRSSTDALLLAPVVDLYHSEQPWRVTLFTTSLEPTQFEAVVGDDAGLWRMGRTLQLGPGQQLTICGYLYVHRGDAAEAWAAFHRFGHTEDFPAVDWLRDARVHYYDFLSAADADGRRGDGYDADLARFGEFHVGLATQHGYYPAIGDYLHPDRKEWQAMVSDPRGAATMSLDKMKARVLATRAAGVHPTVYLHACLFDEGTPLLDRLKDAIVVGASGQPMDFGWQGPDTAKRTWKMSLASSAWREHLLQQAQWIMELLDPDAIVMDETFAALGYDHHADRQGPLSPGGIELMRKMRALVRSFGPEKAFLVSDCSISNMVLWADGEAGDHAYDSLLGNPLYRQEPVRYRAALGNKPWRPCAWNFQKFWSEQIELARNVGAGVGLSNGWLEYTGLTRLQDPIRKAIIQDIESLGKA